MHTLGGVVVHGNMGCSLASGRGLVHDVVGCSLAVWWGRGAQCRGCSRGVYGGPRRRGVFLRCMVYAVVWYSFAVSTSQCGCMVHGVVVVQY